MKKFVWLVAAVLLVAQAAWADRVLSLNLEVYKNDSVNVNYVRMEEGNPTNYVPPGSYSIQATDESGKLILKVPLGISFMLMSDPPTEIDPALIHLRIPYIPAVRHIALLNKEKQIFSQEVIGCNSDDACDIKYESYLSCPSDCPLNKGDGLCIKDKDRICDPDCIPGADPDCEEGKGGVDYALYVIIIAVIVVALVFAYKILRPKGRSIAIKTGD